MSYGAGTPTTTAAAPTLGSGMSGWEKGGLLGAGGLGLGALFGLGGEQESFGGGTPQSYLGQVPDILKKYFAPYQGLVEDPTAKLGEIGSHYTQSPGYHFALQQAMQGIGSAAAAGGMAGSPQQQQQAAGAAQGLASQDYGNYMQRALGLYGTGLTGYRGLGEDLASNLMSQSQLAQLQQEEAAKEKEQRHSDIWGTIGTIGGAAAMALI